VIPTEYFPTGGVKLTRHFDGSQDAKVKVKSIRMSLTQGGPPNREHLLAIRELQDALRGYEFAKKVGKGLELAKRRLQKANERILEVQ
jgi:hypothetical protein